jgi:RNA polymerase sigma factor (sigma-70 family)
MPAADSHSEDHGRENRVRLERLLLDNMAALRAFIRLQMDPALRQIESESDLFQSCCRAALEAADHGFEWLGEPQARSWLFGAVIHRVRSRRQYYLEQKRDVRREVRDPDAWRDLAAAYRTSLDPQASAERKEEVDRVERAMDRLSPEQRNVILWHRLECIPHREIAERLGRTESATRQILARSMAKLSTALRDSRT